MNAHSGLLALALGALALACSKPADRPRVSAGGVPLPPITAEDSTQRAGEVSRIVAEHLEAMHTGNTALLDSLTSPDLVHITPQGTVMTEQQLLEQHRTAAATGYDLVSSTARVFDGDMVVVNAQVKEKTSGKLHHLTQVWVLRDDVPLTATTTKRSAVTLASLPLRRPYAVAAMCCAMARWELASSHASPVSNDPFVSSSAPDGATPMATPLEPKN
jgi:hypothetical protein